jgi:hypothetical protein
MRLLVSGAKRALRHMLREILLIPLPGELVRPLRAFRGDDHPFAGDEILTHFGHGFTFKKN